MANVHYWLFIFNKYLLITVSFSQTTILGFVNDRVSG
jgi:hypothetical protein